MTARVRMPKNSAIMNIRSLARQWTKAAIETLGGIATNGESEMARVAASVALLDRGWGKPSQKHSFADEDGDGPLIVEIVYRQRDDVTPPPPKVIEGAILINGNGKE